MMRHLRPRAAAALLGAALALAVAPGPAASADTTTAPPPPCPDVVIPGVAILPNAIGCWNAIGVQAVRAGVPYQTQGFLYLGYVQAAVYDAVTKIEGRYEPYAAFDVPPSVDVDGASPEAATAAAAFTVLTSAFVGLPAAAQASLPGKYSDYIAALGGTADPRVADGVAVGQASAESLIAARAGDRDESITFTPGPLVAGAWTFAPPPSLQTAQTPWIGVMRPFMLQSASQFRSGPPPDLSRRRWAREFNEVKAYGAVGSAVRTPEQTAVALFWNANAVNQSNQAFQDVAAAHRMDLVDSARMLAMGELVDADTGIACFGSKYTYLFWRPVMAIR
ncbi:MAG TPA: vanadium-dependent haloperoxidase, partial [Baekduia sp.]|nr:vanadium-dependent haloperoxidase [Baekduia sp.]